MNLCKRAMSLLLVTLLTLTLFSTAAAVLAAGEENADDVVVYNLGAQDVLVDWDTESPETESHKIFNEDGSYIITLEDNAFFPYEARFQANGVTTVEWFDSADSAVAVGGHIFGVASAATDASALSRIGFTIGDRYIPAMPEGKTFAPEPGFAPLSLLPLNTVSVTADLTGYLPAELRSVELAAVLSGMSLEQSIGGSDKVAWVKKYDQYSDEDEFRIVERSAALDLTPSSSGRAYVYLELIVGSALQLDPANIRYIVRVYITPPNDVLSFEMYSQEEGGDSRADANVLNPYYNTRYETPRWQISVAPGYTYASELYLGISLNAAYSEVDVTVYKGLYATAAAAEAQGEDVTATVWNQNMSNVDAGLKGVYIGSSNRQAFTLVYRRSSVVTAVESFDLYAYSRANGVDGFYNLFDDSGGSRVFVSNSYESSNAGGIYTYTISLSSGYAANASYYLCLEYISGDTDSESNDKVTKAVLGHYDTLDAAAGATDIQTQLFTSSNYQDENYYYTKGNGYQANFGGGVDFTVFDENNDVYKFTVKTKEETPESQGTVSDIPSLSPDIYFRVDGAVSLGTFTVPYGDDTYYSKGYQTLLINDAVADLAKLKPTFWVADPTKAYAGADGAAEQTSGVSVQDFSNGSVMYTAKAEDGHTVKNYEITFAKKVDGGAALFVNGPDTREVFLNYAYEYRHDIFIANLGAEPLTGLTATLNATNVKLDEYWTVGGDGNDALAAFTDTGSNNSVTNEKEIANAAKLRLLPAEEGEANYSDDGLIEGTLTIESANGGSRVITLTGVAGNPKIITEDVTDAVKYVPYSCLIQTNNMHDWNTVTFSLLSGQLPTGVTLLPNGEIYGVPKETGEFEFTVRADYSYSGFADSIATFTLLVKENTDANVDAAVDPGYSIETRVPDLAAYADHEFKVEGAFDEFRDFFLDGAKLTAGTDYIAENGSTKITIKSQTFQNAGGGTHTIAAEFRLGGDTSKDMRKAAQNYRVNINDGGSGSGSGSGSGGGSRSGSSGAASASTGIITANTVVSDGIASASITDNRVNDEIAGARQKGNILTIIADPQTAASAEVRLTKGALGRIADNGLTLKIDVGGIGVITLDATALKAIASGSGAASDIVVLSVARANKTDLPAAQQALMPNEAVVTKCSIRVDGKDITNFGKGIVTLNIPFALPNGIKAAQVVPYFINESDTALELVMGGYNALTKTVDTRLRHFSTFVALINDKQYEGRGGWYSNSFDWAAQRGLLDKFIVDGQINAAQQVSRADFVTALLKALGIQPLTTFTVGQFSDVSGEDAAYIRTARELGIVNGVGGNLFDPNSTAKRGEQFAIAYNLIKANISAARNNNTGKTIADFKDGDTVPAWLKPALSELLRLGVVQGDGQNLNVRDNFTIDEVCVVLQRMATPE